MSQKHNMHIYRWILYLKLSKGDNKHIYTPRLQNLSTPHEYMSYGCEMYHPMYSVIFLLFWLRNAFIFYEFLLDGHNN